MDFVFFGTPDLARWERRPIWPAIAAGPREGDARDCYRRDIAVEPPGDPVADGVFERTAAAILRYDIFPPSVIVGVLRRTPVEVGDTVGTRYKRLRAVDLFFASRVVARFRATNGELLRSGFTYQTLVGHPELGEETFSVEKHLPTGRVSVELRSWSRPGTLLARATAPVVRRLQVAGNHAALEHLARV